MTTVLEHNITDTLTKLRQARRAGDVNQAKHHEARLNWLLDRLPLPVCEPSPDHLRTG